MNTDVNTTLHDLKRLVDAIDRFEEVKSQIKVISRPSYRKSVLQKYNGNEESTSKIITMELRPRYESYEIERDIIRSVMAGLKDLPDIPTLSEFLQSIKPKDK